MVQSENIICEKGNVILKSYMHNSEKYYNLKLSLSKIDKHKIILHNYFNHNSYLLLEKINSELIEKIHILKIKVLSI